MSKWAEDDRVVSPPSPRPGPWQNSVVPYGAVIMDTISSGRYTDITVIAPSQSAKSELCILNPIGYYTAQEPSSILVIQPNVKPMAEAFSKERIAPMFRDSPRLRDKLKDPRSRDSNNTVLTKNFPGGNLAIVGANSPAGLATRPVRVVLCDELDRWDDSAGTEGDQLGLAGARQKWYGSRKRMVKVSSPGNEGESRIEKEHAKADHAFVYAPCPHCAEPWENPDDERIRTTTPPAGWQVFEWRDTEGKPDIRPGRGDYHLVWDKVEEGDKVVHRTETAGYRCNNCGTIIDDTARPGIVARAQWVFTRRIPGNDRISFVISGLLLPFVRWTDLASLWLEKKDDPEQRKTFFNTDLGLLYVEAGETHDAAKLSERREAWTGDVPRGAGTLTMAVDVQADRLEVLVIAWGEGEESWLVHFEKLFGDPEEADVWQRAEAILNRQWQHEDGATMHICACAVDSGYKQDAVFRWVEPRQLRGVIATKGSDDLKVPVSRAQRGNRDKVKLFSFNTTVFKEVLFARLRRITPGPGYIHVGLEGNTGVSEDSLLQFGAEKRLWERGKVRFIQLSGRRNEFIDLYNIGLVALRTRGATFVKMLGDHARALTDEGVALKAAAENGTTTDPTPEAPSRNWATEGWR
jgi:phage terminase large subunit GpA-like protein